MALQRELSRAVQQFTQEFDAYFAYEVDASDVDMPRDGYSSTGKEFVKSFDVSAPDPEQEFERFFRTVEIYFEMNKVPETDEAFRYRFLRLAVGTRVMDSVVTQERALWDTYATLKALIRSRFVPEPSELLLRSQFFEIVMKPGQTSAEFRDELWRAI